MPEFWVNTFLMKLKKVRTTPNKKRTLELIKQNQMSTPKLHSLLIAINNYHPASGVSNLDGCVNDLLAMKAFVKKHYANLKPAIKTLVDKQATREGVIKTFESHIIKKAKPGDTVLIYYAGHGSFATTATAFAKYDPKAQDESMVCYDSRLPGKHDLSDKEIAVLLSRIDESVHTVVIMDACHSSSMTRSAVDDFNLGKKRFTPRREKEKSRALKSYLLDGDNYYADMWKAEKKVSIPRSKHLLISACDRNELANETADRGGLFTTALLSALEQNRDITYADLFYKVRQAVNRKAKDQNPTFASLEGFNPNTIFLLQNKRKNAKRHAVQCINGSWRMDYGAIHGLPTNAKDIAKLEIALYSNTGNGNVEELLETVKVEKVLLKESILSVAESDQEKTFFGEIQNFPGAMMVAVSGAAANVKKFEKEYQKKPSPFLLLDSTARDSKYQLEVKKDKLLVTLNATGDLLHGVKGVTADATKYITETLEQIETWERLDKLENEKTKIKKAIEVSFLDESDEDNPVESTGSGEMNITFDYPKKGEDRDDDGDLINLYYTIKARNTSGKKLYLTLLHLNASFGISTFFSCGEIPPKSDWIILDNDHGLHIENENWNEVTDVFKIIVSTEPFDDHKFQQDAFERGLIEKNPSSFLSRGVGGRKKSESDWCTHTIRVNSIRKTQSVGNNDITFKKEKIKIKAHPTFKADVAFAPAKSGTRSVHPVAALAEAFNEEDFGLLNLAPANTRSAQDKTIIELSGITNEKVLKKNPLEIEITQKLAPDEQLVPVTYDGEFILPFGNVIKEDDGSSTIRISKLPVSKDKRRKRSVTKAIWFCLLKVTGFRNKAFRLRLAQMNRKGKLVRNRAGINSKVAKAEKILIVVHGIIGDTKGMAESLQFMVDPQDDKKYDLMLSYDYENLNEPIEKIAEEFNKRLEAFDLKVGEKQIDIIAHSMGGLVSRYMIENLRNGDGLINSLVMLGTPNGGSPFGSIPEYISIFRTLSTVAINFGKPFLKPILIYLKALEKFNSTLKTGGFVLVTLDQMNGESKFVKALFKNEKPKTKYFVIAGDITKYTPENGGRLARFSEKMLLKIGDGMNRDLPNDIAVSVDQILDIPPKFKAKEHTVVGHHLNYFHDNVEAMKVLREILL